MVGLNQRSDEDTLSRLRRHVAEAEQHVADQKRIIEKWVGGGHTVQADLARRVLVTLEESLTLARDHLSREQKRASAKERG